MKQIRQITDVVTTSIENEGDENNNENKASLVTIFDRWVQLVAFPCPLFMQLLHITYIPNLHIDFI